jgi:hypothetical protein
MVADKKLYGSVGVDLQYSIVKNMTGWEYYKISWDSETIRKLVSESVIFAETGKGKGIYIPNKKLIDKITSFPSLPELMCLFRSSGVLKNSNS